VIMRGRARWLRFVLALAVVVALMAVSAPWAAKAVGRWLVVADAVEPARAVVVLSGRVPFRAMHAASIYKHGLAPEVWISRPVPTPEELTMRRLGIPHIKTEEERNQQVLERLGVPTAAIRVLDTGVLNTMQEVDVIARELRRAGGERVIIVTSKPHTRRVKAIWQAVIGDAPRMMVQHPAEELFDPDHWWRNTGDALEVSREVFGLMNVWAGFPVRPDRAEASGPRGVR
jgi:uncharacterized SAM-binding protein YcdF (DUF218 family)